MYIDPAAIKEIASGFGGIRSDLRKIAEIVKKALPDGPIAKSLEAQAELAESLKAQGVTEEGLAEQISAANPFEAKVLSELAALEQQYGTLENVPDKVAQRMLTALQMDPDVAILVAAGDGFQIVVSQARAAMVRLLGMVNSAGECTGATLRLVDDLCKYTVSMATGGVAFLESRERIVAMTLDVGSAIAELASSPLESVKLAGKAYAKKCEEIQQLERQGRYDEAQYELGKLLFDVAASIQGLAAAGKVVVSQGSKLAKVVKNVGWTKGALPIDAVSLVSRSHIQEMLAAGVKFTEKDVLFTLRQPDGKIVFLEKGNNKAGLEHVLVHAKEFKGVAEVEIPSMLYHAIAEGTIVGYQGKGAGRPIYDFTFNGQRMRVAITISENGFVVGANPKSIKDIK